PPSAQPAPPANRRAPEQPREYRRGPESAPPIQQSAPQRAPEQPREYRRGPESAPPVRQSAPQHAPESGGGRDRGSANSGAANGGERAVPRQGGGAGEADHGGGRRR